MSGAHPDTRRRTRWLPRDLPPVHVGMYECGVKITSRQRRLFLWTLPWDGAGFVAPIPMIVVQWRGLRSRPRGQR